MIGVFDDQGFFVKKRSLSLFERDAVLPQVGRGLPLVSIEPELRHRLHRSYNRRDWQARHRHSGRVRRTPGISCEAVPACCRGGAGMRRHLRPSAACGARVGAAESFVSLIPLFDRAVPPEPW